MVSGTASGPQPADQTTDVLQTDLDQEVRALAPGWTLQPDVYPRAKSERLYKWVLNPTDDKLSIWMIQYSDATAADARLRGIKLSVGEHWVTGVGDAAFLGFVNRLGPASLYLRVGKTYVQIFVPSSVTFPNSTAVDFALQLGRRVAKILSGR